MRIQHLFTIVLVLCFFGSFQVSAQNDNPQGPPKIEITVGGIFSGPANRMGTQFRNQGFDILSQLSILGLNFGSVQYPLVSDSGTSLSLSYSWAIRPKQRIGIEISHASLGETGGLNRQGDRSNLEFATQGLGVYYSYTARPFIFRVGPQINLNRVYGLENSDQDRNKVSNTFSAGLKVALELCLWNKKITFAKLGVNYLASYATEHGPYPLENSTGTLDASKLNFSYGSLYFGVGLNL